MDLVGMSCFDWLNVNIEDDVKNICAVDVWTINCFFFDITLVLGTWCGSSPTRSQRTDLEHQLHLVGNPWNVCRTARHPQIHFQEVVGNYSNYSLSRCIVFGVEIHADHILSHVAGPILACRSQGMFRDSRSRSSSSTRHSTGICLIKDIILHYCMNICTIA